MRCRNGRSWMSVQGPQPAKSVRCEKAQSIKTACGWLDGEGGSGRDFNFDSTKIEARCNKAEECLFYCKSTSHKARGMFYTRCKTQKSSGDGRWKPRPRITQEPLC